MRGAWSGKEVRETVADHEAHVRVAGERRGLEDALHDDRLDVLVDLEDDDAGELLARVELLPDFLLRLEDVEELVDALEALVVLDRAGVPGRIAVDEDDAPRDRDHRGVDHVESVLRVRELHALRRRRLARGAEGDEEEDDGDDEEVDHARQRQRRVDVAVVATGYALRHELERHRMHQAPGGLCDRHGSVLS
jgi:hypothetical protein